MYAVLVLAMLAPLHELDPFIVKAVQPVAGDSELRKLQKECVRERAMYLARMREAIAFGRFGSEYLGDYLQTQVVFFEDLAALVNDPAAKVRCYEMRVEALKVIEKVVTASVRVGIDPPLNYDLVKPARIDAELELLKLKASLKGK